MEHELETTTGGAGAGDIKAEGAGARASEGEGAGAGEGEGAGAGEGEGEGEGAGAGARAIAELEAGTAREGPGARLESFPVVLASVEVVVVSRETPEASDTLEGPATGGVLLFEVVGIT